MYVFLFILENAMKDSKIDRAVGLCKKIVGLFSHSWKRRRDLAEAQKELKLPVHKLKTECPTRWGSMQVMVQRILEQLPAISHVLSPDRKARHLIPLWQDVEVLEGINKTITSLADFRCPFWGTICQHLFCEASSQSP